MVLRVVFMGTPDFSVPTLSEIVAAGHDVVGVYTQPPRPAGRGMEPKKSPVHAFAEEAGLHVFTPKSLKKAEAQAEFAALGADVAVVVAYGLILPKPVLAAPPLGCLNLHASLLPRWRGAAPIQRAIIAGDAETGVMVMKMEEGLDTGPIALADRISIGADATAGEIHDHLSLMGAPLMLNALDRLPRGELAFTPQPEEGVTYAAKISKDETRIDWSRPGPEVHDKIRGLSPYPGAWFEALLGGKCERVKVLRSVLVPGKGDPGQLLDGHLTVACGSQAVRLTRVQRAGKRAVGGDEFLRGFPLGRGTQFE
ncbi:methionyl-tRNA formyltransferase [Rhodomicrobium vannielii ATCC 17100]|uniref:Methionyl-tRNA formyltransferase n=1 Tax=Rhodomicrobium vannielii (strain ATCC 17100 / DSM 162 / LMG 4299 / NCIMB 10020 / ATH 3.1.1) TaxID=648757 RepID=E3I444_RHOVT|nr:methionyl-tRNA formyltransferase [Rhodomicrobium vannielii]ADP72693.1 methionyl-tRNA formyltransferase [Rhodomicrobium vannielii ATCC 17100]